MAAGVSVRVQVLEEVSMRGSMNWRLCFQWCRYVASDGGLEEGYRFIWRRPDGSLQAARGQARLPSIQTMEKLIRSAQQQGWGHHTGPDDDLKL